MKVVHLLKSIFANAFLRNASANDIEKSCLHEFNSANEARESFDGSEDLDFKLLVARQNAISELKNWYYKLVICIIVLSLLAAILVTFTMVLGVEEDERIVVKLGFIAYEPIVSVIFLIALRSNNRLAYGRSEHDIRLFNCCGDQVILCLMAVDLFWIIAGLTGFMANIRDWLSLVFLLTSIVREVLYGLTSITSDRLVILCVTRIPPKPQHGISAFDRI